MDFQDIDIKTEYRSLIDDIIRDFYIPILDKSICYKRAVGFFSSSSLNEIILGIGCLIRNKGTIKVIASPKLSSEDIVAINKGHVEREKIIEQYIFSEVEDFCNEFDENRINLLSYLIANEILEIRIAVCDNASEIGIYHEKMGLFYDDSDNIIAFSGSMNESNNAYSNNYETIDVFVSWGQDRERVSLKEKAFEHLWNNNEENVSVYTFPETVKRKIFDSATEKDVVYDIYNNKTDIVTYDNNKIHNMPGIPKQVQIRQYQKDAIKAWRENHYIGIFDMATGTGKTYTGIAAICNLYEEFQGNLAVVILCPFQHLVEQWLEDLEVFGISPIVAYGDPKYKDYPKKLRKAVFEYNLGTRKFISVITTINSFSKEKVQNQLEKINKNLLLVVDEAHNMGAKSYRELLTSKYTYRLALSATFDRHNDLEGTESLYDFFGEKCIEYTLEQAIKDGMLTKYKYYPIPVYLTDDELDDYKHISAEIQKNIMLDKRGNTKLNERGKQLAIKRARIVAGAANKIPALLQAIEKYKKEHHILIYCGATTMQEYDIQENYEDEIRQIDKITQCLGLQLNMKVAQFTSRENAAKRKQLKEEFSTGEELQALVAVKCLDEGVNVPAIKTAFILASTTNPKEYIQRRGRVLRLSPGKEYAEIYDFVTLPRDLELVPYLVEEELKFDCSLVKNELNRIEEFQRLSENSYDTFEFIWSIKDAYKIYEEEENEPGISI